MKTPAQWFDYLHGFKTEITEQLIAAIQADAQSELLSLASTAETLLCNSLPMSHSTQQDWDTFVRNWRDAYHKLLPPASRESAGRLDRADDTVAPTEQSLPKGRPEQGAPEPQQHQEQIHPSGQLPAGVPHPPPTEDTAVP